MGDRVMINFYNPNLESGRRFSRNLYSHDGGHNTGNALVSAFAEDGFPASLDPEESLMRFVAWCRRQPRPIHLYAQMQCFFVTRIESSHCPPDLEEILAGKRPANDACWHGMDAGWVVVDVTTWKATAYDGYGFVFNEDEDDEIRTMEIDLMALAEKRKVGRPPMTTENEIPQPTEEPHFDRDTYTELGGGLQALRLVTRRLRLEFGEIEGGWKVWSNIFPGMSSPTGSGRTKGDALAVFFARVIARGFGPNKKGSEDEGKALDVVDALWPEPGSESPRDASIPPEWEDSWQPPAPASVVALPDYALPVADLTDITTRDIQLDPVGWLTSGLAENSDAKSFILNREHLHEMERIDRGWKQYHKKIFGQAPHDSFSVLREVAVKGPRGRFGAPIPTEVFSSLSHGNGDWSPLDASVMKATIEHRTIITTVKVEVPLGFLAGGAPGGIHPEPFIFTEKTKQVAREAIDVVVGVASSVEGQYREGQVDENEVAFRVDSATEEAIRKIEKCLADAPLVDESDPSLLAVQEAGSRETIAKLEARLREAEEKAAKCLVSTDDIPEPTEEGLCDDTCPLMSRDEDCGDDEFVCFRGFNNADDDGYMIPGPGCPRYPVPVTPLPPDATITVTDADPEAGASLRDADPPEGVADPGDDTRE